MGGIRRRSRPGLPLLDCPVAVSRRKFLTNSLAALTGVALPVAAYSEFIEPQHLTIERLELPIANLPDDFDGFRIAQISDLHFGDYIGAREVAAAVDTANSFAPDLAAITGDFVTAPDEAEAASLRDPVYAFVGLCGRELSRLKARHVLGCFGNHDGWNQPYTAEVLADFGVTVLRNTNVAIERSGQRLWVAGVDDGLHGMVNFDRAVSRIPAGEPKLLLAHEPDLADEASRYGFALQLSGHSHGGQIRLPLLGSPYLPALAKKYPYGYYRVGSMHLYTNRGIGMIVLPYRFNAPPEVTLITLRAGPRLR